MDHPNIAKELDGGTTSGEPGYVSAGRPYFEMALVNGVPITDFCDQTHPDHETAGPLSGRTEILVAGDDHSYDVLIAKRPSLQGEAVRSESRCIGLVVQELLEISLHQRVLCFLNADEGVGQGDARQAVVLHLIAPVEPAAVLDGPAEQV